MLNMPHPSIPTRGAAAPGKGPERGDRLQTRSSTGLPDQKYDVLLLSTIVTTLKMYILLQLKKVSFI